MKELLWLLDIWYTTESSETTTHLFSIDQRGQYHEVLDSSVPPHFYAEGIVSEFSLNNIDGYRKCEYVKRKYLGISKDMTKISVNRPMDVSRSPIMRIGAKYQVEDMGYKTHSSDVFYDEVYMTTKKISPCSWFVYDSESGEVSPCPQKLAPPAPYLKKFAFDFEIYNPDGAPNPDKDPVVMVGIKTDIFETYLLADGHDDRALINTLNNMFITYNPDVPLTFYGDASDYPYWMRRCEVHGYPLCLGRDNARSEVKISQYSSISIQGRANVDVFDFGINYVKARTNEQSEVYEAVFGTRNDYPIDRSRIWEMWDGEERNEIIRHCMADVEQTYALGEHCLGFGKALSSLVTVPLDQVFKLPTPRALEQGMFNFALRAGEVIPNIHKGMHQTYVGALTFQPLPGLHEDAYYIDFTGMYPNTSIRYNISPDTLDENGDIVIEAEGYVHRFSSKRQGFFVDMMKEYLGERKRLKDMKVTDKSMDFAIKTICAASTGYFGWHKARWHSPPVIRCITAKSRETEDNARHISQRLGWTVLYGDTDSTFVCDKEKQGLNIDTLLKTITDEVGFVIKIDDIFKRIGFGNAKKRYFGLTQDDRIVVRGLEAIRGDWCYMAKFSQNKVIDLVLRDADIPRAIQFVKQQINRLKTYNFSIEDVIIRKRLQQEIWKYDTDTAHVKAAERMEEAKVGEKIEYVIVKGWSHRLSDRVKLPEEVRSLHEIDIAYYAHKQLIPACMRVLAHVAYKKPKTLGQLK